MNKRVTWAKLHTTFFIPGVGTMSDTLPNPAKTLDGFEMYLQDSGSLLIKWRDGKYSKSFLVGAATVVGALLVPEETPTKPVVVAVPSKKSA